MIARKKTNDRSDNLDPDVELLNKLTGILSIINGFEFIYDIELIRSEFYKLRNAFLEACVKESENFLHDKTEKDKITTEINTRINEFEVMIQNESLEINHAYVLFNTGNYNPPIIL